MCYPRSVPKWAFVIPLALLLASCATTAPTASSSPSASPTVAASPSPSPTPSPTGLAGFACADASGGTVATSDVSGASVASASGYDSFVIAFASGVPAYTVARQATTTFTRVPRGDTVTLQGTSGVLITFHSVSNWTSYAGPTSFDPMSPVIRQALLVQNNEGYQQWALGVSGSGCLRVSTLTYPDRLVVDIAA